MVKKLYSAMVITLFVILGFIGISSIDANSYAMTTEDIGYYDCWLHADGTTWQNGIKPGSTVTPTFTVSLPIDTSKTLSSYSVQYLPYTQGNYTNSYYKYAVNNGGITAYKYLGKGQMQYSIKTTLRANEVTNGMDITREEQSKLVQGRRFYIPVLITWEYAYVSGKGGGTGYCHPAGEVTTGCSLWMENGYYTYQEFDKNGKILYKKSGKYNGGTLGPK